MILAAAIIGSGATRQANSHGKAALGVGNSVDVLETVVDTAERVAAWNKVALPARIDVLALSVELKANLGEQ